MRIKINIQIFSVIILLILTKQIDIYAWLMLFALIHELAHMYTGLLLHLKPRTIEIEPFGVGIIFESLRKNEKDKIIIALAGPVINFILAFAFLFINTKQQSIIINANLYLGIFNLMPIYPLDGGRILKSILKMKNNRMYSEALVNKIGNVLMIIITIISSVMILVYRNIGLFLIIVYLWIIVVKENKKFIIKNRINNLLEKQKYT